MQLFHQNMRTFGGGTLARNAAYTAQFAGIQAANVLNPILVAGFTEVTNNGAAAAAFVGGPAAGLCGALGVTQFANIACGTTALANGPEYIAIGVAAGVPVAGWGRVFLNVDHGGVGLINDYYPGAAPPPAAWCNHIPAAATRDFRGLVYVVVGAPGYPTACVAFLHNLYSFEAERILVMGAVPNMLRMIAANSPVNVAYIGGDFNSQVLDPRGTRRIGFAYASAQGLFVPPMVRPPAPAYPFVPGGTTWAGNLYDYWYSTINPLAAPPAPFVVPVPAVDGRTLDCGGGVYGLMSDHCATLLSI